MPNLRINILVPSLADLTPIGPDQYQFTVEIFNNAGQMISGGNIPNPYVGTVTTTQEAFAIEIPVATGPYEYPGATIKVYNGLDTSCCYASLITNINAGGSGNIEARLVSRGWPEHLDVTKTREGSGWRIKDIKQYELDPSGNYEWSYLLNEFWQRNGTANLDIFWPADTPLMIYKAQTKIGLDTFNKFDVTKPPGGYYDPEAVKPFNNNTPFAHTSLTFND